MRILHGWAKACRNSHATQWYKIVLENERREHENCIGIAQESVEKEGNERYNWTAAGNKKEPVAEAGEWTQVTRKNRKGHKEANKKHPWGDTKMIDKCRNVQLGTKETIGSGEFG